MKHVAFLHEHRIEWDTVALVVFAALLGAVMATTAIF